MGILKKPPVQEVVDDPVLSISAESEVRNAIMHDARVFIPDEIRERLPDDTISDYSLGSFDSGDCVNPDRAILDIINARRQVRNSFYHGLTA